MYVFFCKQKTEYEMRISDWSSDVCSSDLLKVPQRQPKRGRHVAERRAGGRGGNASRVDVVLDRERHAIQRQVFQVLALQRGEVRFQLPGRQQVDEQVVVRVQRRGFFPQAQQ